jgi:hypothetical protein
MTRIEVPNTTGRRSFGSRLGRGLGILLLILAAGTGLWTWLTLSWSYADGERAGVLQKFVRRGWLCKTHEGEIALYYGGGTYLGTGTTRQIWDFSSRDAAVAAQLSKAVGHRVQLHYTEHPGIPTDCFGETRYFVDRVTITDNDVAAPGPPPLPTPSTAPTAPSSAPSAVPAPQAPASAAGSGAP